MRGVHAVVAGLLTMASAVPAQAQSVVDAQRIFGGEWNCTVAGGVPRQRTFTALDRARSARGPFEFFGVADSALANGNREEWIEHWTSGSGGTIRIEAPEGTGTAAAIGSPIRVTGRSFDDTAPFTLTYTSAETTLHRVATIGNKVVDDERCMRLPAPPAMACATPNVPARTVHAAQPAYVYQRKTALVQVRVVLDAHSRLLWSDVQSSTNPALDAIALQAANESTYQTAIVNCRPAVAEYIFSVQFGS